MIDLKIACHRLTVPDKGPTRCTHNAHLCTYLCCRCLGRFMAQGRHPRRCSKLRLLLMVQQTRKRCLMAGRPWSVIDPEAAIADAGPLRRSKPMR